MSGGLEHHIGQPLQASGALLPLERALRFVNRIVMDRFVLDHERITRTFPEGTGTVELIATYEVVDGRIINAWILPGLKTLDPQ